MLKCSELQNRWSVITSTRVVWPRFSVLVDRFCALYRVIILRSSIATGSKLFICKWRLGIGDDVDSSLWKVFSLFFSLMFFFRTHLNSKWTPQTTSIQGTTLLTPWTTHWEVFDASSHLFSCNCLAAFISSVVRCRLLQGKFLHELLSHYGHAPDMVWNEFYELNRKRPAGFLRP